MLTAIIFSFGIAFGAAHPALTLGADSQNSVILLDHASSAAAPASKPAPPSAEAISALNSDGGIGVLSKSSGGGIGALSSGGGIGALSKRSGGGIGALSSGGGIGALSRRSGGGIGALSSGGGIGALRK